LFDPHLSPKTKEDAVEIFSVSALWYITLALRTVVGNVLHPWFLKRKVVANTLKGKSDRDKFLLQYLFACPLAMLIAWILDDWYFNVSVLLIVILGIGNGIGAYCQWRAIEINLSKMSVLGVWNDIVALTLAFAILGESEFLNGKMVWGLAFVILALGILKSQDLKKQGEERAASILLYRYVFGYTTIWGTAEFCKRYFALEGIEPATFLFGYYSGSLISALGIYFLVGNTPLKERVVLLPKIFSAKNVWIICILVSLTASNIWLLYVLYQMAPVVIVKPVLVAIGLTVPTVMGLYIFREIKDLNLAQRLALPIAIIGGLLVATSH
jgi:multidrug transporter EmrE-like cation transporter